MVNLLKTNGQMTSAQTNKVWTVLFSGARNTNLTTKLNASYYGVDVKDKLDRHYANANYNFAVPQMVQA